MSEYEGQIVGNLQFCKSFIDINKINLIIKFLLKIFLNTKNLIMKNTYASTFSIHLCENAISRVPATVKVSTK
jgi:hypothetical protein